MEAQIEYQSFSNRTMDECHCFWCDSEPIVSLEYYKSKPKLTIATCGKHFPKGVDLINLRWRESCVAGVSLTKEEK